MTATEIENLFKKEVAKKNFTKKTGFDKQVVYNYRNRKLPTLGTMLEVLFIIGAIKVKLNELTT